MVQRQKLRNSSIELLRIVCMMFIVMHHIIITTIAPNFCNPFYNVLDTIFHIAVVVFVIITGYFGISFKLGRLIRLWAQIAFYSILAGFVAYFVLHTISIKQLCDCALPIYRKPYWFMSSYVELFLVAPALNAVVNNLNRKELLFTIVALLYSTNVFPPDVILSSGLLLFSLLYLIGRYLAIYKNEDYKSNTKLILMLVVYLILTIPFYLLQPDSTIFQKFISFGYRYFGLGTIFMSIIVFYLFKNITLYNKTINWAAASVLSIYLIHENHLISFYIYEYPTKYLLGYVPSFLAMIIVAFFVTVSCILFDKIRVALFRYIEPVFLWVENAVCSIVNRILHIVGVIV